MPIVKRITFLSTIYVLVWLCFAGTVSPAEDIRIHFINCGYGDCILLELGKEETLLIDAGGKERASHLLNYLKNQKIKRIHTAIVTHPHQNHFEGFTRIMKTIPIDDILINGDKNAEDGFTQLMTLINKKKISLGVVQRGGRIKTGVAGVSIEILHPANLNSSPNENSLVTLVKYFDVMFLFTADIGPPQQDDLVTNFPEIKFANVIQIPHHGGPVSDRFIRTFLNPVFVISTGKNKWGIPTDEDLQKMRGTVLRTDMNGAIVFESNGQSIRIIENRDQK